MKKIAKKAGMIVRIDGILDIQVWECIISHIASYLLLK